MEPGIPHTFNDVFPWAWDGPLSGSGLMECGICGAAVASTDAHVAWHNSQRSDLRNEEGTVNQCAVCGGWFSVHRGWCTPALRNEEGQ